MEHDYHQLSRAKSPNTTAALQHRQSLPPVPAVSPGAAGGTTVDRAEAS